MLPSDGAGIPRGHSERFGVVCALVDTRSSRPEHVRATRDALTISVPSPDHVLVPAPDEGAGGLSAALATGAAWVWLFDGVTVPAPGAFAAFETAAERLAGLPAPLVLASKILDGGGALHPDATPRHEIFEKDLTVGAVERGLVQLRAAPSGSLLIRREAFQRFGSPRTDLSPSWAAFEFTARVLQAHEDTGYLVPSSLAVRMVPPRPPGRRGGAVRARARLLPGPAWNATERLWEGFLIAEGAVRGVRESARRA